MATDLLARKVSIGFPGGNITATRGLLEAVFGEALVQQQAGEPRQVSRKGHTRVRVIGGPATGVSASTANFGPGGGARDLNTMGGEAIQVLYEGDWWTMRLNGSHRAFNEFLGSAQYQAGKLVMWRSEKGTTYGPFTSETEIIGA